MSGTQSANDVPTQQIKMKVSDTTTDHLIVRSLAKAEIQRFSAHPIASSSPTGLMDEHIC